MKLLVTIYKSPVKEEMYLYVEKRKGLEAAPEALLKVFGKPVPVMDMLLTPERQLAREDIAKVMDNIQTQGYHLQMPPAREDYLQTLPEEFLSFNDPV